MTPEKPTKPICTAENPAPPGSRWKHLCSHSNNWNLEYEHPDAVEESIDDVYEDYEYTCPHCKQSYIAEGPDA